MTQTILRLVLAALFAVSGAAALVAQVPGDPVGIDFFVTGPDGNVFDLRADEISLKVGGRVRPIRSLRYVSLPAADPVGTPVEPVPELEPPYATNVAEVGGRWVTIVADDESIRPGAEKNTINAAVRLVNSLGPRDRVSYITMPNGGLEVDYTTDHQKVVAALRRFIGRAPRESTEQDRSCRSRLILNGMRDLLEGLAPLPGPKTIVLVSSGLLNPRRDAPADRPPGPCEIRQIYFQEVGSAATMARAHLFVIQPDDLNVESSRASFVDPTASRFAAADAERAGLESLAGVTNGDFHRIVGPDDNTLTAWVKEMSGYYVATFEPERGEYDGLPHRVEISVSRPRMRVRTRPNIVIPKGVAKRATTATAIEVLRESVLYGGLPLRAIAVTGAGDGPRVKVMAILEPVETGVTLTSAVFGLIDSRDRLVVQWTANATELAASPVTTAGYALPGPYRLRVAAIDSKGRRGSVEYDFTARMAEANPLALSGIILGTAPGNKFMPKLLFGADPNAIAYFEVYGTPPTPDSVTVRLEVAATEDGRALAAGAPARVITQAADRRMVLGAVPIGPLPAGDYVLRAIVSVDGRPVGRISRTLRKTTTG